MQTKKDDLREEIIKIAEREFVKRGYKNSSMRTIASKSHTTLGNLYTYFENKEAILTCVIGDTPEKIYQLIKNHNLFYYPADDSKEYLEKNFDEIADAFIPTLPFPIDLLLGDSFLILMEGCEGTKYETCKDTFLTLCQNHLAHHLNVEPNSFLAKSLIQGFLASLIFIGKNKKNMEEGKKSLINYIKTIALGMPMIK